MQALSVVNSLKLYLTAFNKTNLKARLECKIHVYSIYDQKG